MAKEKPVESVLVIPLSESMRAPQRDRADRSVTLVRDFVGRHSKVAAASVKIGPALNEAIWAHGAKSVPKKLQVHAKKLEDGRTVVELVNVPFPIEEGEKEKGKEKKKEKAEPVKKGEAPQDKK
jgi:ribosomal protein L31E